MCILPVLDGEEEPVTVLTNQVPLSQTDLLANFKLPKNTGFERRRPWGMKAEEINKEDRKDPELNFTFTIASNKNPKIILDRIKFK